MDTIVLAFADAFTLGPLIAVFGGVALGVLVGAIPGLNAPMAMAIAVPLTMTWEPLAAVAMLVGVMKGAGYGGAIAAILLNTPGEPSAAATALDGHPLAKSGKPRKALKMALYSSVSGDTTSDITLILLAAPLAAIASQAGRVEQASILLFSFTIIAALSGKSLLKGVIATLLGVLLSLVGRVEGGLAERFTFDSILLAEGLPLTAVAIGALAMPELMSRFATAGQSVGDAPVIVESTDKSDRSVSFMELWKNRFVLARGALIGTGIGALPGIGSSVAAFLSYSITQNRSTSRQSFGKGNISGIAATESANSAVNGANMIPLLTLGIPGNVTAALLVGAFVVHGIDIGPQVFAEEGRLVYALFVCMLLANVSTLLIGRIGLGSFVVVTRLPGQVLYPIVVLLCIVGVYLSAGGLFGVWVMIGTAVMGWIMARYQFSLVNFIIGFVLGGAFESALRGTVTILYREPFEEALRHPFALLMVAITIATVVLDQVRRSKEKTASKTG